MENLKRLLKSSDAIGLPSFEKEELLKCLMKLLDIDRSWIHD